MKASKLFSFVVAAASGTASLTYLLVSMRRLSLIFGRTPLADTLALAVFLGGLAAGAWIFGRRADRLPRSVMKNLAALEIGTGLYGLASVWIFHGVAGLYFASYSSLADHKIMFAAVQLVLSALAILLPALLMGGILPLLACGTALDAGAIAGDGGAVYGYVALGAALGAALTTYGLLPAIGLDGTIWSTGALNVLVGGAVLLAGMRTRKPGMPGNAEVLKPAHVTHAFPNRIAEATILIAFLLSSVAVVAFESVWTRLFDMVTGSTVYAQGTLGFVSMVGLGFGSVIYSRAQRTNKGHLQWFAILEFLIAFTASLSMIIFPRIAVLFLHFFPLIRDDFGRQIAAYFAGAILVALIPSLLFGATFPAALGSLGHPEARIGRTMGMIFATNMIGTAAGVCLTGLILIPVIGLHATMVFAVLLTIAIGTTVWWRVRPPGVPDLRAVAPATAALVIVMATLHAWPRDVFAAGIGFFAPRYEGESVEDITSGTHMIYYRDGASSTVSVDEAGTTLFYRSNGKTEASTDPMDVANQILLGHLPMLLHPAPRDVAVLGLSTGMTAAAVARYPVERIDIIEMEPVAVQAARYFDSYTGKVLNDRRVHLTIGDGRNRLLGMPQQYDVVISELPDVWIAGSSSLDTVEYYRAVGARLKPGGVFVQRVDTRALPLDQFDLITASFHAVFPHVQIWTSGPGNLILLGSRDPIAWDYARLKRHLAGTPGLADDLKSIGIWSSYALFAGEILGESESDSLSRDVGLSHTTDDRPVLEFRTPRYLYAESDSAIMDGLNYYRRPDAPAIVGFDPQRDLDANGTYLLGFGYASLGRSDMGITYMKRSTTMSPNSPMFFVGLGNQYRLAGRIGDADAAFERAVSLDTDNVEALVSLGEIRLDEGQLEWTRVLSDRALQLAPQDARVHALIGRLQDAER